MKRIIFFKYLITVVFMGFGLGWRTKTSFVPPTGPSELTPGMKFKARRGEIWRGAGQWLLVRPGKTGEKSKCGLVIPEWAVNSWWCQNLDTPGEDPRLLSFNLRQFSKSMQRRFYDAA